VSASDAAGLIAALEHAGVPAQYIALVPELPGDFNRDGVVDAADYVVWRKNFGVSINLPNETMSLGFVDQFDYDVWRLNFGTSLGAGSGAAGYGHRDSGPGASAAPLSAAVPEPATFALAALALVGLVVHARRSIPNQLTGGSGGFGRAGTRHTFLPCAGAQPNGSRAFNSNWNSSGRRHLFLWVPCLRSEAT
jgi:hypothetical protein